MSSREDVFEQFGQNSGYIRELYELYRSDPSLVSDSWANFFSSLGTTETTNGFHTPQYVNGAAQASGVDMTLQARATELINAYRTRGHYYANVNPLHQGVPERPTIPELNIEHYSFTESDLGTTVDCARLAGASSQKLRDVISTLQGLYCGSAGFEYMHLSNIEEREFIRERVESRRDFSFSETERKHILEKLIVSESLESSLHKKYVGQKRFSLEGGETIIPMLTLALDRGLEHGLQQAMIGMSHRGRLNVLTNIVGKPLSVIFTEFEDRKVTPSNGSGDVKYHLGYTSNCELPSGNSVRVYLAPNPSHLEFIDPVLDGMARAHQEISHGSNRQAVMPILIHGEAAFAGQGIVFETINFAGVAGYECGGTLHLIINNQVGFTATAEEQRSTWYSSDLAKGAEIPVFHVNGEDIEAACWVMRIATDFRMKFGRDVIVELMCYRKYGHNEGDDPSFTQPLMYNEIRAKSLLSKVYLEHLTSLGVAGEAEYSQIQTRFAEHFEAQHAESLKTPEEKTQTAESSKRGGEKTAASKGDLQRVAKAILTLPDGFVPHPKLFKIIEKRTHAIEEGSGIEWGVGEALAFGTLMLDGINIRLSGQDVGRGTFSHRHARLDHFEKMESCIPLSSLSNEEGAGRLEAYNSVLSEAGVLGFEFGYAHAAEKSLVLWEAQFGDFANGAQVIIDQFIVSSEAKWNFLSGVTLLLPHGYEGQGPEHSSARLERFLALCGEGNMGVCYPSSSVQYFHLLRRQALTKVKRPLVIMTPKSLLRLPEAGSKTEDFVKGSWNKIITSSYGSDKKTDVVFFMSGKIYYDVDAALKKANITKGVKVVRIEELHPFPVDEIRPFIDDTSAKIVWVQEEPRNMGGWRYMQSQFGGHFSLGLVYVGRPYAASTAAGSHKRHAAEQKKIVDEVLALVG